MNWEESLDELQEITAEYEAEWKKQYASELESALEQEMWRTSIIFLWGVFLVELYEKIEDYDIARFQTEAELRNACDKNLESKADINEVKDQVALAIADEEGIISNQYRDDLEHILDKRNDCAHYGDYIPQKSFVESSLKDVINSIKRVRKVDFSQPDFQLMQQLQNVDEINEMEVNGGRSKRIISVIWRNAFPIERFEEGRKNQLKYIHYCFTESTDRETRERALNLAFAILEKKNNLREFDDSSLGLLEDSIKSMVRSQLFRDQCSKDEFRDQIITILGDSKFPEDAKLASSCVKKATSEFDEANWRMLSEKIKANEAIIKSEEAKSNLKPKLIRNKDKLREPTIEQLKDLKFL